MKKHTILLALLLLLSMAAKAQEITVSPSLLTDFFYIEDEGPSGESVFTVSATGLINMLNMADTLVLSANEYFEISTQSGAGFGSTLRLFADANGTVEGTTVYVRMVEGLIVDSYEEDILITTQMGTASDVTVHCSGTVIMPTLPVPAFSLEGDTYIGEQQVNITCNVEGAVVQYRLNPNGVWTYFSEPLLVDRDMTIWAKATKGGYIDSPEVSTEYVILYAIDVTSDPEQGTVNGGGVFHYGDIATLSATPNEGFVFSSWSNGETNNPIEIAVTGNASYYANFEAIGYQITVAADPEIGGVVVGGGSYHFPETPTITATANENYAFVNWTENDTVVSEEPEYTIIGWASRTFVAHFRLTTLPTIVGVITNPDPVCAGNSLQLDAPEVWLADTAGWQISPDSTFAVFSTYTDLTLDETYNGWHLRYMASNEAGTTYSNQVAITVYPVVDVEAVVAIEGKNCGDIIEHILVYPKKGYCYQWYFDDVALPDTTQYIHNENGLTSGVYRVEISFSRNADGQLRCPVSSPEYEVRWLGKSVYPNPARSQTTLFVENDGEEDAVLTVVSVEGKTIFRQLLKTGQNTLDISLPKGIYVFSFADSQSVRTEKVIIQ